MARLNNHRVVVTGMGMSTALGASLPACWSRILAGDSGISPITFWDPSAYSVKVAAEVHHVPREDTGLNSVRRSWCRRSVRLFAAVAREAFTDAQLDRAPLEPSAIGLAVGANVSYLDMHLLKDYYRFRRPDLMSLDLARFAKQGCQPENSFYRRLGDMVAALPARLLKLSGATFVMDTACASSAHAIGEAYLRVRRGMTKAMLAGGTCALVTPLAILGFGLLGALSRSPDPEKASRPFDINRDGFVMGEGAGAVVLENLESARARGARIYAELVGYGSTLNAHNMTDPSPDGESEGRAMQMALRDGDVAPDEVDYIAAHGTSTPKNDYAETVAIKRVFRGHAYRLMVSSIKAQIGHTIAAAGVCNLVCAVKAMTEGKVPPTMHLSHPDPECDLDYVPNQSRPASVRAALVNAFAFGGQNAVLAVRAWTA